MTQAIKEKASVYASGYPTESVITRNKYNLKVNSGLKAARRLKGYSLPKVHKILKEQGHSYGLSTLTSYEANELSTNHRYPSLHTLILLSQIYDCSLDYIFGISDNPKPPIDDAKKLLQSDRIVKWGDHVLSPEEKEELIYRYEKTSLDMLDLLESDFPLTWEEKDIKIEHRNMIKLKAKQIMSL